MKLIISRKSSSLAPTPSEGELSNLLNSGFGNTVKVVPDNEVESYIHTQALRGQTCFEFDYTGAYQSQTTVIKSQAA